MFGAKPCVQAVHRRHTWHGSIGCVASTIRFLALAESLSVMPSKPARRPQPDGSWGAVDASDPVHFSWQVKFDPQAPVNELLNPPRLGDTAAA